MNILIPALAIKKSGGATRLLRNFLSAIGRIDKENKYIVCVNKDYKLNIEDEKIKVLPFYIKSNLHRFYWDQFEMRKLVKELKIDLILSLLNFGCINPSVKQLNFQAGPTPFCQNYVKTLRLRGKIDTSIRRKLLHMTMKASEVIITPSKAMRDMIRDFYSDIKESKFKVIHHAFDKERFLNSNPLPSDVEKRLINIEPDTIKILYVSHLIPYKGYDVIIKAAKRLREWKTRFKFIVTMDRVDWPEGYDLYLSMIEKFGLSKNLLILNRVPEDAVANLYKQCDIFMFPSLCESFGFPMVEAMGSGLPIVAAGTPVNKEICGKGALYYDPLDAEEAVQKVRLLIEDNAVAEKLKQNAITQLANAHINWDVYVKEYLHLFNEVLNG
ncbi:MAG: glycosyltransferase family 4 protein [Candidatus Scalinduaceae bacterium]